LRPSQNLVFRNLSPPSNSLVVPGAIRLDLPTTGFEMAAIFFARTGATGQLIHLFPGPL